MPDNPLPFVPHPDIPNYSLSPAALAKLQKREAEDQFWAEVVGAYLRTVRDG